MTTAFQADTFQNDTFQIDGAASSALRFNSSLNGLGASGPFFADRLAVEFEDETATRFRSFVATALRVGLPHEA